jgi:hypothetical protein
VGVCTVKKPRQRHDLLDTDTCVRVCVRARVCVYVCV